MNSQSKTVRNADLFYTVINFSYGTTEYFRSLESATRSLVEADRHDDGYNDVVVLENERRPNSTMIFTSDVTDKVMDKLIEDWIWNAEIYDCGGPSPPVYLNEKAAGRAWDKMHELWREKYPAAASAADHQQVLSWGASQ